ncbi:hypothetical protein [Nonomuraea rubra]|uniref:hypothetical protein n=1 Tax=Nonomuraea rubra TaxID=46180 RepID=UPI0031EF9B88
MMLFEPAHQERDTAVVDQAVDQAQDKDAVEGVSVLDLLCVQQQVEQAGGEEAEEAARQSWAAPRSAWCQRHSPGPSEWRRNDHQQLAATTKMKAKLDRLSR